MLAKVLIRAAMDIQHQSTADTRLEDAFMRTHAIVADLYAHMTKKVYGEDVPDTMFSDNPVIRKYLRESGERFELGLKGAGLIRFWVGQDDDGAVILKTRLYPPSLCEMVKFADYLDEDMEIDFNELGPCGYLSDAFMEVIFSFDTETGEVTAVSSRDRPKIMQIFSELEENKSLFY